jgi:hypothetical protein
MTFVTPDPNNRYYVEKRCYLNIAGTTTFCRTELPKPMSLVQQIEREMALSSDDDEERVIGKSNAEKAKEAREWYAQNRR